MLFTRCPECETTFRVTDETLLKANGQVRCGRCASVFNAYAELHDPAAKNFETEAAKPRAPSEEPPAALPPLPAPPAAVPPAAAPSQSNAARAEAAAAGGGADSPAEVVVEADAAAEDETPVADSAEAAAQSNPDLSATEIERVLTSSVAPPLPQSVYVWPAAAGAAGERRAQSRGWAVAAALALLALGAQAIHHFRASLASHPTFGPWISQAYGTLGAEIAPSWDVRQYQIIDWVATAEPNSRGIGSLKITARIQNRGPQRQPYPAVQLRLRDRWEEAVGSRMFAPAEYLPRDTPRDRLVSPGETARAELEVVDPGPDAYGFELDVCIEVEASLVTCGTDKVFL
jgi:predicted Zn finger-like uncharacterized protein